MNNTYDRILNLVTDESAESKAHGKEAGRLKASGAHPEDVAKEIIQGKASKDPKVAKQVKGYMNFKGGHAATPNLNLRARLAAKKSGRPLQR